MQYLLLIHDDPHGPIEQRGGAMTQDDAGKLARQLGVKLKISC